MPRHWKCPTPAVRPAFTLIELLVVISIVSLLIAMLLPTLSAAREVARDVQCKTNIRSVAQASIAYMSDTGFIPGSFTTKDVVYSGTISTVSNNAERFGWTAGGALLLSGHLSATIPNGAATFTVPVFLCPSGILRQSFASPTLNKATFHNQLLQRPDLWPVLNGTSQVATSMTHNSISMNPRFEQSFSINSRFHRIVQMGDHLAAGDRPRRVPIRESNISHIAPSRLLFWIEHRHDSALGMAPVTHADFRGARDQTWPYRTPHRDRANYAAFDGHAGSRTAAQINAAHAAGTNLLAAEAALGLSWGTN